MTCHVCLVSHQAIANLVPAILEKPGRVVLLVSSEMRVQASRLAKVLKPRGIRCEQTEIDPYDFDGVLAVCEELVDGADGELTLNVTGGTKISALAAFQAFYFNNQRIIYLDTAHNRLQQLAPQREFADVEKNLVSVADYLTVYGLTIARGGRPHEKHGERAALLPKLATFLSENERLLGSWNRALTDCWKEGGGYANIPLNRLGDGAEELADLFQQCGVAAIGHNHINVHGEDDRFFCQGGWLEEYVYSLVCRAGLAGCRPAINLHLRWDESGRQPTFNELDLVFTYQNRLHVISCKSSRLDDEGKNSGKGAIYELNSLAEKAGGLFGRALLVSCRTLSKADRDRARRMKIEVCDGRDFHDLPHRLRNWCRGE